MVAQLGEQLLSIKVEIKFDIFRYFFFFFYLQTKYLDETENAMKTLFKNTMDILVNLAKLQFPFPLVCVFILINDKIELCLQRYMFQCDKGCISIIPLLKKEKKNKLFILI